MDVGKNVNPQWAPDGKSLAFVSDRNGVSNIFLYDLTDRASYQLTDFYTGAQGITPLSPILSWAAASDQLAYVYYEDGKYDVYKLPNPRSLKREAWHAGMPTITAAALARDTSRFTDTTKAPVAGGGSALYRGARGLRPADSLVRSLDSLAPRKELSIIALMDSASLGLPDTASFTERKYKVGFSPDYVARPSIGYARDNFGRGFFGGTTVSLSDMLGDRQLVFSGYINGRIDEAQVLAAYANLSRRASWAVGLQQDPYFFYQGSFITDGPTDFEQTFVTRYRRLVLRSAFVQGSYPFSRFSRVETGVRATNVDDAILDINEVYDPFTGALTRDIYQERTGLGSTSFLQPTLALVHDNSLGGYVGPMLGRSSRFEIAPTVGGWKYIQTTADYRRYDKLVGPFTVATRLMYYGRSGRDADRFSLYLGYPDLLRGYTSGSYFRNECSNAVADPNTATGCVALDQLVGTSFAVGNAELRFPVMSPNWSWVPRAIPPIEGAVFYDIGVAWTGGTRVAWNREAGESPAAVRTPLRSVGLSLRTNLFGLVILRFDYSKPLQRPGTNPFWTISFGPTF